jgi:hypothetical protein
MEKSNKILTEEINRIKSMMKSINENEFGGPNEMDPDEDDDNYEDEEPMCSSCNGTGEGMYDGSRCRVCGGSGVEEKDYDDYDGPDDYDSGDDYDVRSKEWGGMDF